MADAEHALPGESAGDLLGAPPLLSSATASR
jgi:hypothetical protein